MTDRLGERLKGLHVPPESVARVVAMLGNDEATAAGRASAERVRLESRTKAIRNRIAAAYTDKVDGKISEDFWERKTNEWRTEERQLKLAVDGSGTADPTSRALSAEKAFELANKAHSLYLSQNSFEKARLLRMLVSNFSVSALSV